MIYLGLNFSSQKRDILKGGCIHIISTVSFMIQLELLSEPSYYTKIMQSNQFLIIPYLNGEESAWYLQHRGIVEVAGEQFDVDGGGHKN